MRKAVIYLDTILLYNVIADDLLLLAAGRLSGLPLQRGRIFLAAGLGGIYAAAAAVPQAYILQSPWMKLLSAALMVWIAFGRKPRFLRRFLLFLLVSGAFAGVELALCGWSGGTPSFPLPLFFGSFAVCWLLLGVVFRGSGAPAASDCLVTLSVVRGGDSVRVRALRDSGCALRDPADGRPVAVVELSCLTQLFSPEEQQRLKQQESSPDFPLVVLPFRSVGGCGTLAAFRADTLAVGKTVYQKALVAVHPESLGGEMFHALWGGEENVF